MAACWAVQWVSIAVALSVALLVVVTVAVSEDLLVVWKAELWA